MLAPTAYLTRLRDIVKSEEPELWAFFASAPRVSVLVEELRSQLLRSAYRLDGAAHAEVAAAAAVAAERLGLVDPVTLYQANDSAGYPGNAVCISLPGEVHVVFSGTLLEMLDADELTAVLGHELAHHALWSVDGGDYWVLDRLMSASADDLGAAASHEESARLVRLNTELVADRGAVLAADGDASVAIAALVKLSTGLRSIDGAAYLAQAKEVLAGSKGSDGQSHPETFFRAWALDRWVQDAASAEGEVAARLRGDLDLDRLDLVAQHQLTSLSHRLVRQFVEPAWARTDPLLGHARLFGAPAVPRARSRPDPLTPVDVADLGAAGSDYLAYVLLDLATADEDVEDVSFAAACVISQELGIGKAFDAVARKETGVTLKALQAKRADAPSVLARATT